MNRVLTTNKAIKKIVGVQKDIVYALDTPTGLSLSVNAVGNKIVASWTSVENATSYTVKYRRSDSNTWSSNDPSNPPTTTSYSFSYTKGKTYYVKVKASGLAGESDYSQPEVIAPTQIRDLSFSYSTDTVSVGTVITATPDPSIATVTYKWYRVDGNGTTSIANESSATYTIKAEDVGYQIRCTAYGAGAYYGTPHAITATAIS